MPYTACKPLSFIKETSECKQANAFDSPGEAEPLNKLLASFGQAQADKRIFISPLRR